MHSSCCNVNTGAKASDSESQKLKHDQLIEEMNTGMLHKLFSKQTAA